MNITLFIQLIREFIAQNNLDAALRQLRDLLEHSPLLDEALHQSGRFEAVRRHIRLGTVSHAEATMTENQIRAGLLDLLREIAEKTAEPSGHPDAAALRREVEQAISFVNSKNVLVGSSISAGGDAHIGDKTIHQTIQHVHNYGNNPTPEKEPAAQSTWQNRAKLAGITVATLSVLAAIAEISGYSLRDVLNKNDQTEELSKVPPEHPKPDTVFIANPQASEPQKPANSPQRNTSGITIDQKTSGNNAHNIVTQGDVIINNPHSDWENRSFPAIPALAMMGSIMVNWIMFLPECTVYNATYNATPTAFQHAHFTHGFKKAAPTGLASDSTHAIGKMFWPKRELLVT